MNHLKLYWPIAAAVAIYLPIVVLVAWACRKRLGFKVRNSWLIGLAWPVILAVLVAVLGLVLAAAILLLPVGLLLLLVSVYYRIKLSFSKKQGLEL